MNLLHLMTAIVLIGLAMVPALAALDRPERLTIREQFSSKRK